MSKGIAATFKWKILVTLGLCSNWRAEHDTKKTGPRRQRANPRATLSGQ